MIVEGSDEIVKIAHVLPKPLLALAWHPNAAFICKSLI
jgi:hypothetical protein